MTATASGPTLLRRTLDILRLGLADRVPREHHQEDGPFRRRRVASVATLVVGALALAGSLRLPHDSAWFTPAAFLVAAVWAVGAFASGPLHVGRISVRGQLRRPLLPPLLTGAALALVFLGGAFATRLVPYLSGQAEHVLGFARQGTLPVLVAVTVVSGIAEELFFRGALYAAVREPRQVWVVTGAYFVATLLSGNVMLAFAAAVLGFVASLQRRSTGGVVAPIITHVTWSTTMLLALPHIF